MDLPDDSPHAIGILLRYLYTKESIFNILLASSGQRTSSISLAIVSSADKYLLPELAKSASEFLKLDCSAVKYRLSGEEIRNGEIIDIVEGVWAENACGLLKEARDVIVEAIVDYMQCMKSFRPIMQTLMTEHPSFGTQVLAKISDLLAKGDMNP